MPNGLPESDVDPTISSTTGMPKGHPTRVRKEWGNEGFGLG